MNFIESRVKSIIANALYIDAAEVKSDANLMGDLGAESIDFLDILFRLEKEFAIKIPRGEIESRARGNLTSEEFVVNGALTAKALQQIQQVMPEVSMNLVKPGFMLRDFPSLFTVATFVRIVDEQVGSSANSSPIKPKSIDAYTRRSVAHAVTSHMQPLSTH